MVGHLHLERGQPFGVGRTHAFMSLGEQPVACAHRGFTVAVRYGGTAWPGLSASVSRSRKRAGARYAGSTNSRSIAGVSHSIVTHSASAVAATGAPWMRTSITWRVRARMAGCHGGDHADCPPSAPPPRQTRHGPPAAPSRSAAHAISASSAHGRKQRYRLQHIGLARAILAGQHDEARPGARSRRPGGCGNR